MYENEYDNYNYNPYPNFSRMNTYNNIFADNNNSNTLAEFKYEKRDRYDFINKSTCSICNSDFSENDLVIKLLCGHLLHKDCYNKQNQNQNKSIGPICPACTDWLYQNY